MLHLRPPLIVELFFSPIAKTAVIRLLVQLANKFDWDLSHVNVDGAFIQLNLDYEIYMKLPPRCGSMSDRIVCLLNKSLH